jgi:hypothetical protein
LWPRSMRSGRSLSAMWCISRPASGTGTALRRIRRCHTLPSRLQVVKAAGNHPVHIEHGRTLTLWASVPSARLHACYGPPRS